MDDDKILELTSKIESTLGKEQFAMISDTVGELLTGNAMNMQTIKDRDETIAKLEDRNEKLVTANGALLQKVPMEYESVSKNSKAKKSDSKEDTKKISYKEIFDSKGNFLK